MPLPTITASVLTSVPFIFANLNRYTLLQPTYSSFSGKALSSVKSTATMPPRQIFRSGSGKLLRLNRENFEQGIFISHSGNNIGKLTCLFVQVNQTRILPGGINRVEFKM
jgi:hypothetical protein